MIKKFPLEAVIWCGALVCLAFYNPSEGSHVTLCPFYHLGFDFCPGCGLGRSIAYFFHGEILKSFLAHPLGIFASIILSFRIAQLTNQYIKAYGQSH
jgi:hypothetical protein